MKTLLKSSFFIRITIVIFWIIIIFGFLYSSLLKKNDASNSINILSWSTLITNDDVTNFEKKTGIKVNLNYYDTNDELFAKLEVTKGKEYDLILIIDNGLDFFIKNNLAKKINKNKFKFWNKIDSHFFGHYFDPNYEYSIPYFWDICGLGINKKFFNNKLPLASWDLIFNRNLIPAKISMTDDPYNAILIASQYLYNDIENITSERLKEIQSLLINQKKWVELYADTRADYALKSNITPTVVALNSYIFNAVTSDENLAFVIPKEGGFITIDLFVIPIYSNKEDLTYKFIEFLYDNKLLKLHHENSGYLPVVKDVLYSINLNYLGGIENLFKEKFNRLSFFKTEIPLDEINKIWINVKA